MKFFDTNVLIAASLQHHAFHDVCSARMSELRVSGCACSAHTMVEAFSVLTRLPVRYRIPHSEALKIVDATVEYAELIVLTAEETIRVLRALAAEDKGGGLAFDALLIACARKVQAETIYTLNVKHFRQIAPDLASRIVQP